jgi:dihydroflavonol-4-reductase
MKVLVTGATGFLGKHVVKALKEAGHEVRALVRRESQRLAGVEQVRGDIEDVDSVRAALAGVEQVQHLAGLVSRDPKDASRMMRVHVEGTRRLLEVAAASGVKRVIVASSSGTVGVSKDPEFVATDESPWAIATAKGWPYYLSKIYQEQVALSQKAVPVVILNPSLLLGPGDDRCSSTDDVRKFLQRKIPVLPEGGLSFVDVRDVAPVFVTAMDKARPGERYLMGGPNWTFATFFGRLARLSKVPGPRFKLPERWARVGATLMQELASWRGVEAPVDRISVEMAQHFWYIDSSKARDELGFEARDPQETLADTVRYLKKHFLSEDDGESWLSA